MAERRKKEIKEERVSLVNRDEQSKPEAIRESKYPGEVKHPKGAEPRIVHPSNNTLPPAARMLFYPCIGFKRENA